MYAGFFTIKKTYMTLIRQALPAGFSDAFVYLPLCAAKLKQKLLCQPGLWCIVSLLPHRVGFYAVAEIWEHLAVPSSLGKL